MTKNLYPVPIGEIVVSADPDDVLVVYGLGSCVVIGLYDPLAQVGGILHALLPTQNGYNNGSGKATKFVDQGLPLLLDSLVTLGAIPIRLKAYLCGGAQMVTGPGINDIINIGQRNVLAAKMALQAAGLKVQTQATGGHIGRTIKLYLANGQVTLKMIGQEEQNLL